jgi:hypothetical protein
LPNARCDRTLYDPLGLEQQRIFSAHQASSLLRAALAVHPNRTLNASVRAASLDELQPSSSPMTLDELTAQRDALLAARYRGLRTVEIEGRRVTYASDAEMAAAITGLERRIAAAENGRRRRRIPTSASKGL